MHAPVGRQREDLDQRLGLAQPPRTIGDDIVADGDRKTAQQADARLGAAARGSPLADEPTATTRGRRARRRLPRTGAGRGPRLARDDSPRHARAGRWSWRAECGSPPVGHTRRGALHEHLVAAGQLHSIGPDHGADHQHAHRPRRAVLWIRWLPRDPVGHATMSPGRGSDTPAGVRRGTAGRQLTVISSSLPWCSW